MGAWGNLFLGKDFIYSTGEYVCWDQAAGFRGVALVYVLRGVQYICVVCVCRRVWKRIGRCVGFLNQGVEREKETMKILPAVCISTRSWLDKERYWEAKDLGRHSRS